MAVLGTNKPVIADAFFDRAGIRQRLSNSVRQLQAGNRFRSLPLTSPIRRRRQSASISPNQLGTRADAHEC